MPVYPTYQFLRTVHINVQPELRLCVCVTKYIANVGVYQFYTLIMCLWPTGCTCIVPKCLKGSVS